MLIYFAGAPGGGGKKREERWQELIDRRLISYYHIIHDDVEHSGISNHTLPQSIERIKNENLLRRKLSPDDSGRKRKRSRKNYARKR